MSLARPLRLGIPTQEALFFSSVSILHIRRASLLRDSLKHILLTCSVSPWKKASTYVCFERLQGRVRSIVQGSLGQSYPQASITHFLLLGLLPLRVVGFLSEVYTAQPILLCSKNRFDSVSSVVFSNAFTR